jgi:hypothetical protein
MNWIDIETQAHELTIHIIYSITIDLHNINIKYNIAPQQIILPFIVQMFVL